VPFVAISLSSSASSGDTRSSGSISRTHSHSAASIATFLLTLYISLFVVEITRAARSRAIAAVSSALPLSTTTISFAISRTLSRHERMKRASLCADITTEMPGRNWVSSAGSRSSLLWCIGGPGSVAAAAKRPPSIETRHLRPPARGKGRFLYRLLRVMETRSW
jgi:hypothetical protein